MSLPEKISFCGELLKAIRERRSIRRYEREPVSLDDLKLLVEAARWAPSGSNLQPWKFVIVTDRNVIEAIKMMSPGILMGPPPALIVLCHDEKRVEGERELQLMDLGAAMQNILLMAHVLGLGACPIASFDGESVAELLELSSHIKPVLLICVGKPADKPKPPPKLSIDELVIKVFKEK
jgi:nitroreductase